MRQITKKGMSLGDMYPAVLTIVLVGILLGAGLYMLAETREGLAQQHVNTQKGINTSAGTTTLTNASLTNFKIVDGSTMNATNQTGTAVTNFTYTSAGVITWGLDVQATNATDLINVTFTYIYDVTDSPEATLSTVVGGLDDFASWIAIIVVVIAAAVVLGVVLSSFGRRRAAI